MKEAFNDLDIMKAGLTTTSNSQLLETGGMFILEASQNGNELKLKKGEDILSQLPNIHPDKNMMLFDGEKDSAGNINWINPKEFETDLLTLEITTLDFYPEGYKIELNTVRTEIIHDSLQYKDYDVLRDSLYNIREREFNYPKKFTDSLYYSYARLFKKSKKKELQMSDDIFIDVVGVEDDFELSDTEQVEVVEEKDSSEDCPIPTGINPAKIKAIWNKKFNKTILATKEFEERMKVIHETHRDRILKIYVSNINKPLWYSDSIAMKKTRGALKKKFTAFYIERKGGVKVSDRLSNKLSSYFDNKQKEFTNKSAELFENYETEKRKLRKEFYDKKSKKSKEEIKRRLDVFNEEYNLNLCEAYRQLGKRGCRDEYISRARPFRVKIGLGPKNIDAYVFESTKNRTTLDYTDSRTGKKAMINYDVMNVKITNTEKFDKVFAYLIPDSLSSFNRMKTSDNINFNLPLNELLNYKLVCVAYQGDKVYYDEMRNVSAKDYKITLVPSTEAKVKRILKSNSNLIQTQIKSDQEFYQVSATFSKVNHRYRDQEYLNLRVGRFLFPDVADACFANRRYGLEGSFEKVTSRAQEW